MSVVQPDAWMGGTAAQGSVQSLQSWRRRWGWRGWMVTPCGVMGWTVISTVSWLHDHEQVRTSLNIGFVIYKREIISAS